MAIFSLELEIQQLRQQAATAARSLDQVARAAQVVDTRIRATDRGLVDSARSTGTAARGFSDLGSRMATTSAVASGLRTVLAQTFGTFALIREARRTLDFLVDFDKKLSDAAKAANFSDAELKRVRQSFVDLAQTPGIGTRATELADLAATAGTLGVRGADQIENFVEVTAKLGNSLRGVDAATVAEAAGRILNLTGEGAQGITEFGNVLARLEDNVANSSQAILEVGKQVATATAQFKTSSTDVLGLAGGFADLGVSAELARSTTLQAFLGIQGAIQDGGAQLQLLSRLTGIAAGDIQKQFGENATNVFVRFVGGLKAAADQGVATEQVLKQFGLEGLRVNAVIPTLAENVDRFASSLVTARKEGEEQTKLNEDTARSAATLKDSFDQFNATLDAVKDKLNGSSGELKAFIDTTRGAIAIIFGIEAASKDASESSRKMAESLKAVAVFGGAVSALGLARFFASATLGATGLGTALGKIGLGGFIRQTLVATAAISALSFGSQIAESKEFAIGLVLVRRELDLIRSTLLSSLGEEGIQKLNTALVALKTTAPNIVRAFLPDTLIDPKSILDPAQVRAQAEAAVNEIAGVFNSNLPRLTNNTFVLNSKLQVTDVETSFKPLLDGLLADVSTLTEGLKASLAGAFDELTASESPSAALAENTDQTAKNLDDARAKMAAVNALLGEAKGLSTEEFKIIESTRKAEEERVKLLEQAEAARKRALDSLEEQRKSLAQEIELIGLSNEERERAIRLSRFQEDSAKAFGANTAESARQVAEFDAQLGKLQDLEKLKDVAGVIGDSFGSALDSIIDKAVDGTLKLEDLGTAFQDLGKDILKGLSQELITEPIVDGIKKSVFSALSDTPTANTGSGGGVLSGLFGGNDPTTAAAGTAGASGIQSEIAKAASQINAQSIAIQASVVNLTGTNVTGGAGGGLGGFGGTGGIQSALGGPSTGGGVDLGSLSTFQGQIPTGQPVTVGAGGTGGGGILDQLLGSLGLGAAGNSTDVISAVTAQGGGSSILSGLLTPGASAGGTAVAAGGTAATGAGAGLLGSLGGLGGALGGLGGILSLAGGLSSGNNQQTGSGIGSLLGLGLGILLPGVGTVLGPLLGSLLGGAAGGLFAKGGAFLGGRQIRAFANGGIINQPTLFPMRDGIGLMGELDSEAVFPITRDSSGRLAVHAVGGGGGGNQRSGRGGRGGDSITLNINGVRTTDDFRRNRYHTADEFTNRLRSRRSQARS